MWYLRFSIPSTSSGPSPPRVALGLSDGSSPTYVDSRLTIHPSFPSPSHATTADPKLASASTLLAGVDKMPGSYRPQITSTISANPSGPSGIHSRPPTTLPEISIRLQSPRKYLLGEPLPNHTTTSTTTSARSRAKAKAGVASSSAFKPEEGGYEVEGMLDGRVLDGRLGDG